MKAYVLLIFSVMLACNYNPTTSTEADDPMLASVYDRGLTYSELAPFLTDASNKADSLTTLRSYTDNWIKNELLLREARLRNPDNVDIEELVNNYRESLLLHHYEELLIETSMDTIITDEERKQYYASHEADYILSKDIYLPLYVKFELNEAISDDFKKIWSDLEPSKLGLLLNHLKEQKHSFHFDSLQWHDKDMVASLTQSDISQLTKLGSGDKSELSSDEHIGYLWVFDHRKIGELAPFSYQIDQIDRVIFFKRRKALLKQKREELYRSEKLKNNIKIYLE